MIEGNKYFFIDDSQVTQTEIKYNTQIIDE